jgi:hypothetical protein
MECHLRQLGLYPPNLDHCRSEVDQLSRVLVRLEGFKVDVNGKELPISVAAGWKAYESGNQILDLIEEADRKLYLNKKIVKKQGQDVLTSA